MTELNMKDIILLSEIDSTMTVGENSIFKNHPNFLPTVIDNLIAEKVKDDIEAIEKGLKLLEYYVPKGLKDYNSNIERLFDIAKKINK